MLFFLHIGGYLLIKCHVVLFGSLISHHPHTCPFETIASSILSIHTVTVMGPHLFLASTLLTFQITSAVPLNFPSIFLIHISVCLEQNMKRRRRRDILRVQLVRIFELLADAGVISHRWVLDSDLQNFGVVRECFLLEMRENRKVPLQQKYLIRMSTSVNNYQLKRHPVHEPTARSYVPSEAEAEMP